MTKLHMDLSILLKHGMIILSIGCKAKRKASCTCKYGLAYEEVSQRTEKPNEETQYADVRFVPGRCFPHAGVRLQGSWPGPKTRVRRNAASFGAKRNGESPCLSPGPGNPDLRVPDACGDWPMESPLQRQERRGYAGNTVRYDVYRFELPNGNVGARPIRLFTLLPL